MTTSNSSKGCLDAEYLRKRSFALDLRILWLTLWNVARRDGVATERWRSSATDLR